MANSQQERLARRGFSLVIAFLLLTMLFINYIDRQTLSVLVPYLPGELRMSNVTYGQMQGLFLFAYALSLPFAGWVVDRLGTSLGLSLMVGFWSLIEFLHGTARSVTTLGVYRLLLGIPEAAGFPAVSKTAAEHAAPHARATLVGIAMFGVGMGSTLAPPAVAFLSLRFGWSWAFYATGIAGFTWLIVWLLVYRSRPSSPATSLSNPAPKQGSRVSWSQLLTDRRVIALTIVRPFSDSIWWIYLFWIPPFLAQTRGLNLHEMGVLSWIPYFFASVGSVAGGYGSGLLVRRGWEPLRARKAALWVCAAVVPVTSLVVKADQVAAVLALLAVATFFIQGFFANIFTLPADLFPHYQVASIVGLNTMVGSLAGSFAVQGAGYLVDHYSYTPVFVATAFCLPIGALLTQVLLHSEETTSAERISAA